MKRRIIIKADSASASQILESLGQNEVEFSVDLEDCGATYKKLSTIDGILDWEFEDERTENSESEEEYIEVESNGSGDGISGECSRNNAAILFQALFALKLNYPTKSFNSLTEHDLKEQVDHILCQPASINLLIIKEALEKEYSSAEEAKEKVVEIYKTQWDNILSYGTSLGFLAFLCNKKKKANDNR